MSNAFACARCGYGLSPSMKVCPECGFPATETREIEAKRDLDHEDVRNTEGRTYEETGDRILLSAIAALVLNVIGGATSGYRGDIRLTAFLFAPLALLSTALLVLPRLIAYRTRRIPAWIVEAAGVLVMLLCVLSTILVLSQLV